MSFVAAERLKNVRKSATRRLYDAAPAGAINMGLGEPDFPTPPVIRREAIRVINEEPLGYTPNAGLAALREKVAALHSNGSLAPYTRESVCITNGSEEALFAAVMSIVGPGDEMLLPDPGFTAYPMLAEIAGAQVVRYRLPARSRFEFDRESFMQGLNDRTRLVLIVSPSNPTGRAISRADLEFIAARMTGSNAYIVADEIYRELYFNDRPASISEFSGKTIIVSGLSKMMSMTGWRLGWAVGPPDVIEKITLTHQYISTCASVISQRAAIAAFSDEGRDATASMRNELRRRRDVLTRALETELQANFIAGDGAFYVMLDVSMYGKSEEVAWRLLEKGVITVPGSAFGEESEGYLRLSFCIEPGLIAEGVRRIASCLKKLPRV